MVEEHESKNIKSESESQESVGVGKVIFMRVAVNRTGRMWKAGGIGLPNPQQDLVRHVRHRKKIRRKRDAIMNGIKNERMNGRKMDR